MSRGFPRFNSLGRWMAAVVALLGLLASPNLRRCAAQVPQKEFSQEVKTLTTGDKRVIVVNYYPSVRGKESPVVVLLHMKNGNRNIWKGNGRFAERLQQKEGYAVIAVDLRNHGDSQPADGAVNQARGGKKPAAPELKPADYRAMYEQDMEAVKQFIFDEHQAERLNMNKLGIVGPEMGATIAAFFAANDWAKPPYPDGQPGFETPRGQDVRALALISPEAGFHGLAMPQVLKSLRDPLKGIAFLVAVSKDDPKDKGQAKRIFDQAAAPPDSSKRMYYQEYPGKLKGTDLFYQRLRIEDDIVTFFDEHLKKLNSPWRDRKSKLIE